MKHGETTFSHGFVLGQVVKILRGRNKMAYAIVVELTNDRAVKIADGNKRKMDNPKTKNILHLEATTEINHDIAASLCTTGKVTNGKLRVALLKFLENTNAVTLGKEPVHG